MTILYLIYGNPGKGKTYLAHKLKDENSCNHFPVDDAYVEFIRENCPKLFFDRLDLYIFGHYMHILKDSDYSKAQFGRDFVDEWHKHLLARIEGLVARHERVAVEGYLLFDCWNCFEAKLKNKARVFPIEVEDTKYRYHSSPITFEDIVNLE